MEPWEYTKKRAHETLAVWEGRAPGLKIGAQGVPEMAALIGRFEPLAQQRVEAQDDYDAAYRAGQDALLCMRVLGTKVPALIEGHLDEDEAIVRDLKAVYATSPRTEATILKRLRELLPIWVRADAAMAALSPAQPGITRSVAGKVYGVAEAEALLDGFTLVVKNASDMEKALNEVEAALRAHDAECDRLNKRFYKVAKATADEGSSLAEGLRGITTEPATPPPKPIEIATISQGGERGLQVLLSYAPEGGKHATTRLVRWQVAGVDADFAHSTPLAAAGNALGPFEEGQTIKVMTEVRNSVAARTSAPRMMTIGPPVV